MASKQTRGTANGGPPSSSNLKKHRASGLPFGLLLCFGLFGFPSGHVIESGFSDPGSLKPLSLRNQCSPKFTGTPTRNPSTTSKQKQNSVMADITNMEMAELFNVSFQRFQESLISEKG